MIFNYKNKKYCFLHIPKSGGTYIELYILKHLYGEDTVNEENWYSYGEFLYDNINNNHVHMPLNLINISNHECFCIIRNPYDTRISAYNWIKEHESYKKTFNEYIISGDFKFYPKDNKTRISTFGLKQVDYISNVKCKKFLYQNFNKCLDYIDNIFGKKIKRFKKINFSKNRNKIIITNNIKKIIYKYFQDDFVLYKKLAVQ